MKRYTIKELCKGCGTEMIISFDAKPAFDPFSVDMTCPECKSELAIHVKRGMFKRQIYTKVSMVAHTDQLLQLLKEREHANRNTLH